MTAHSREYATGAASRTATSTDRYRDPHARMPCENALHFLRDFGLLSPRLPVDVARALAAQLPTTELVSDGDFDGHAASRNQVDRLTFVAFVQFLQRYAVCGMCAACARDVGWQRQRPGVALVARTHSNTLCATDALLQVCRLGVWAS